jgi:hypothetical protein
LGSAGVVDADEQQLGHGLGPGAGGLRGRGELFLGESGGEDREVGPDLGVRFERLPGIADGFEDGLGGKDPVVVVAEVVDDAGVGLVVVIKIGHGPPRFGSLGRAGIGD